MRSSIDQRFAVTPTDDLTVEHQVLWSDGLRPANRPVDPDNVGHVWAAVSDHEADLHVLVVEGPGSSFSWSTAVCVVRGRSAVWTMTGPGIGMAELFAALDDPETRPADVPADVVAARLTTRRSTRTPPRSARLCRDDGAPTPATHDRTVTSVDPLAYLTAALAAAPVSVPQPKRRGRAPGAEQAIDADDPMPWRIKSACRDSDPNIFYPQLSPTDRWDRTDPDVSAAMSLCRVCNVQADCLTYALEHREDEGIWGGTDPFTRRAMLRSMGGRISSGNVPIETPEPVAEVIELTLDDREPTAAELAELEADIDLDIDADLEFDDPSEDDDPFDQELPAS